MSNPRLDLSFARSWFAFLVLVWGGLVALFAARGVIDALPTATVRIVLGGLIALPVGLYARYPRLQMLVEAEDLRWLTLFHIWRLPAGLAFLWHGAQGDIPSLFAALAGWGDVAAGVLAAGAVAILPQCSGDTAQWGYVAFHSFGMLDFAVAVGTGLTFSLLGNPLMEAVRGLPLALIVFFGVPVTASLSIATLHRLFPAPLTEFSPALGGNQE